MSAGTSARTAGRVALAVWLSASLAGCGVPEDAHPRALEAREVPFAAAPGSPAAEPVGDVPVSLYFVRDDAVQQVSRTVERSTSTAALVELLLRGPVPEESDAGLVSVIPPTLRVEDVTMSGQTAVITLAGPASEELRAPALAFAQIVATLVPARAERVRFRLDGRDLPVPLADSTLTPAPLTRADYAELIAPVPSPTPQVGSEEPVPSGSTGPPPA